MIAVRLEPVDTWFFRDGTPFASDATPQDDVGSLFPPHPATPVGALRVALALARGWNGRGRWPESLNEVLGNGPEDLGRLRFDGPFLLRCGKPLFRPPRHLLGVREADGWRPCVLLRLGEEVWCDLGKKVRLPDLPEECRTGAKLRTGDREWLTLEGMTSVLRGVLPQASEIVKSKDLWSIEERIGLERDNETRSAKEGMLYSTRQIRPGRGVSLGMRIAGLPADWAGGLVDRLVPLGGESRLAQCREWQDGAELDALPAPVGADGRAVLGALSPLDLDEAVLRGERPLDALGGAKVVAACLDRPQRIGGWNSLARRPLPLRSVLAPGSVLFCEIPEDGRNAAAGLLRIGERTAWGFGLVAAGAWPKDRETGT